MFEPVVAFFSAPSNKWIVYPMAVFFIFDGIVLYGLKTKLKEHLNKRQRASEQTPVRIKGMPPLEGKEIDRVLSLAANISILIGVAVGALALAYSP